MNETETRPSDYRFVLAPGESGKLVIELSNLGSGSMRTIKRELKVLVEDYGYKKMISGCIQVKEEE